MIFKCVCIQITMKMLSQSGSHSFWVSSYEDVKKRWSCALLHAKCCCFVLCINHCDRFTQYWASPSEEEEEKKEKEKKMKILAVLVLSGSALSWCFSAPLGVLLVIKIPAQRWMVHCYKCLWVYCFWDLEKCFDIIIYCMPILSLLTKMTISNIWIFVC